MYMYVCMYVVSCGTVEHQATLKEDAITAPTVTYQPVVMFRSPVRFTRCCGREYSTERMIRCVPVRTHRTTTDGSNTKSIPSNQ
jgi:hypothetical protein